MKYLLSILILNLAILLAPTEAFACDPLGCFMTGKDQNTVALVEVISYEFDDVTVQPYYVFPLNVVKQTEPLLIRNLLSDREFVAGDRYLVSLLCKAQDCSLAWGAWAVTGNDLESTKLKTIRNGDDAAIQTYISSGGTLTDYYSNGDKTYLRTPSAGDMEIYPNIPAEFPGPVSSTVQRLTWWPIPLTVLSVVGCILYFSWRKRNK